MRALAHFISPAYVVVALVISLILIAPLPLGQQLPILIVFPESVNPGIVVYVAGIDFAPFSTIWIYLDGELVGTTESDQYGFFEVYMQLPVDMEPGIYMISAEDEEGRVASATITVVIPKIILSKQTARVGDRVAVSVVDLAPELPYLVFLSGIPVYPIAFSDENGNMKLDIYIPPVESGRHKIQIVYNPFSGFQPVVVAEEEITIVDGVVLENTVKESIEELRNRASRAEERIEDLEHAISRIEEAVQQKTNELAESIATLKTEVYRNITKASDELRNELEALKGEAYRNISTAVESLRQEIAGVAEEAETSIASLENTIDEARRALEQEISRSRSEMQNKINSLDSRLATAEQEISSVRQSIYNLSTDIQEINSYLDLLERKTAENYRSIEMLNNALSDVSSTLERLERSLDILLSIAIVATVVLAIIYVARVRARLKID